MTDNETSNKYLTNCIHHQVCQGAYNCQTKCQYFEERPQGEWLWLGDNPNSNHKWSCSKCGRGVKEQENFCPNCGADMQKGGVE